jgi:hypothetical protein
MYFHQSCPESILFCVLSFGHYFIQFRRLLNNLATTIGSSVKKINNNNSKGEQNMNIFGAIYMPFIGEMMEGKERTEKRKGELVQQFRNLKNLPRKKKKKENSSQHALFS